MKPSGSRDLKFFGVIEKSVMAALVVGGAVSIFGCQFQSEKKDSVLIVAVDAIPQIYCDEGIGQEVLFKTLCQESVRFTHAFTTSTSAQAALASILTGLFPFEHRLRDNSTRSTLSAKFETLAERALREGYRTSLISGGPPIWRTSGLGQGFEMVEDNVTLSQERLFRKFGESVDLFIGWTEQVDSDVPFFSVLYAPDNRFLNPNSNDYLSSEFERLIAELKKKKRWDSTHVVLVGLSGAGLPLYDPLPMSLTNRTTQVPLLVKPARKPRDTPLIWKVDANVSLADIGAGILKLLGGGEPEIPAEEGRQGAPKKMFQVQSLDPIFLGSTVSFEGQRLIPIESAWADWRWGWNIRFALLNGENLYIHDKEPLIYNTLVDRDQSLPLNSEDPNFRGPFAIFEKKVLEMGWKAFDVVSPAAWRLMKRLESDPLLSAGVSSEILKEKDKLPGWMRNWIDSTRARADFKNQDWKFFHPFHNHIFIINTIYSI
ncbi:MAG: sulfatase-like hydrolase/transferase, partial [Bdellovibrionales bacterium]|nr:sulfatase-like hydrolase/transferase [Bdellovibrionales bacterium]